MKEKKLEPFREMVMGTSVSPKMEYFQRKGDHVSHFIMVLAACRSSSSTAWFVKQECRLFELRWHYLSETQRADFLKRNHIELEQVEAKKLKELEQASAKFIDEKNIYYKVQFQQVSSLIRLRKVFIENGIAYILKNQILSYLSTIHHKMLDHKCKEAKMKMASVQYDERLRFFLYELKEGARDAHDTLELGKLTLNEIHPLSKRSFPLCMEILHRNLLKDHHLRNGGRFQYNNFLKCIGLGMHDAQQFWFNHFRMKMNSQEIEKKKYMYEFRHSYGKEGKRVSYPPQSCAKIIDKMPGPLDYHGCPFKVQDEQMLMVTLSTKKGLSRKDANEIIEIAQKGMPQLACSKHFEINHGQPSPAVITHPHKYFIYSKIIHSADVEDGSKENESRKIKPKSLRINENCHCSKSAFDW